MWWYNSVLLLYWGHTYTKNEDDHHDDSDSYCVSWLDFAFAMKVDGAFFPGTLYTSRLGPSNERQWHDSGSITTPFSIHVFHIWRLNCFIYNVMYICIMMTKTERDIEAMWYFGCYWYLSSNLVLFIQTTCLWYLWVLYSQQLH